MTNNTLSTNIKEIENCRFEIDLTIPYQSYLEEYGLIKKDIAKNLKLPGFRQGKVPESMVEKKFQPSMEAKATEKVISKSYQEALQKKKWKVFGTPELQELPKVAQQKDIEIKLIVDRYPVCTTNNFSGVEITVNDCELKPEDVQKAIRRQLRSEGKLEVSEEAFAPEYMAKCDIDIVSEIEDKELKKRLPFKDITFDATLVESIEELSGEFGFLGIGKEVLGLKEGEKKKITKKIEANFGLDSLQGKKIELEVTVNEIKKIHLPKIDAELLKKWDYKSEDDMKSKITKQYEDLIVMKKKQDKERFLLAQLREKNKFDISEKFIDHIIANTIENEKKQNPMMAQSLEGQSFDKIKELYQERAIIDIKNSLLLNCYLENNKVEASEEDLNDKLEEIAKMQNQDVKELRRNLIKSGEYTRLKNNLNHEKLIETILKEGKEITGKTLSFEKFLEEKAS